MSLSNLVVYQDYNCNGSVTNFTIPFTWFQTSQIKVYLLNELTGEKTLLTLTTNYTFSPNDVSPTSINTVATYSSDYKIRVARETPLTQVTEYIDDTFVATDHEKGLDRIVMQNQEIAARLSRAVVLNALDAGADVELPLLSENPGGLVMVNTDGDGFTIGDSIAGIEESVQEAETAAGDAQAAQAAAEAAQAAAEVAAAGAAAAVQDHIDDPTDAHDASAIGFDPTGTSLSSTDVQDAMVELDGIIAGSTAAAGVSYDPTASGLLATDVQAAIDEVEDRVDTLEADVAPVAGLVTDVADLELMVPDGNDFLEFEELVNDPATPSSGLKRVFAKQDGKVYTLDDNGIRQELGAGSGGGGGRKNYVTNGTLEVDASEWFTSDVSKLSFARNVSSPLAGEGDLSISKLGVNAQNAYVYTNIDLPDSYYFGKPLLLSFLYDFSGSANYASGDLRARVYDVTNGAYLGVFPVANLDSNGGLLKTKAQAVVMCQPPANCTQIHIRLEVVVTGTSTWSGNVDDVEMGPDSPTPMIGMRTEIVTANGSFTGGTLRVSKVGNIVTISSNSALTHSSSNTVASSAGLIPAWARPAATKLNLCYFDSNTYVTRFGVAADGSISTAYVDWAGAVVNRTSVDDRLTISYVVADAEVNVMSSFEASLQSGKFRASRNGTNQTGVNSNNSYVKININSLSGSPDFSPNGYFDTTNSRFVALKPLSIIIGGGITVLGTNVVANQYQLYLRVYNAANSNLYNTVISDEPNPGASAPFSLAGSNLLNLNQGDYVELHMFGVGNNSSNTLTLSGGVGGTYMWGMVQPDFSVFGAFLGQTYYQRKALQSSVSSITTLTAISGLQLNNLVVGRTYKVSAKLELQSDSAGPSVVATMIHNSAIIAEFRSRLDDMIADRYECCGFLEATFVAAATTVTFNVLGDVGTWAVNGAANSYRSYVDIEELPGHVVTTRFT